MKKLRFEEVTIKSKITQSTKFVFGSIISDPTVCAYNYCIYCCSRYLNVRALGASGVALVVKNPPANAGDTKT